MRARTLALVSGDVTRYTGAASRYGSFEPRLDRRRPARPRSPPQLPRSPDAGVDEVLRDARHPGHRAGGELGRDPGAVQMGLRLPQSRRRLPRGSLQPAACHCREPARVVVRHVDDRSRHDVRRASRHARAHGDQRGVLHPCCARSDFGLPSRPDAIARGGLPSDGDLRGCDRRGLRRLRGGSSESRLAMGVRNVRRRWHCVRAAPVFVLEEPRSNRTARQLAEDVSGRSAPRASEQRLVHPARALFHAARAGRLGRAGLDAGDPEGGVRHRAGPGGRVGDVLLAISGHRRRDCRRLAGRSLDARRVREAESLRAPSA